MVLLVERYRGRPVRGTVHAVLLPAQLPYDQQEDDKDARIEEARLWRPTHVLRRSHPAPPWLQ